MSSDPGLARRIFRKMPVWFKVWYANRRFRRRLTGLDAAHIFDHHLGGQPSSLAFGIVHFNAPDYLLLNIRRLARLYPRSRVYVLDNGSDANVWSRLILDLSHCPCVSYYKAGGESEHAVGLQFVLGESARNGDRHLCLLDQDCLLINPIDPLLEYFSQGIALIGPTYFHRPGKIHSSLAILQPQAIYALFGEKAFTYCQTYTEPMFGLSERLAGKVMCLEHRFNDPHPYISTYLYGGVPIAYHGWYSSRTFGMGEGDLLDGDAKKVADVRSWRQRNYEFMKEALK